MRDFYKIILDNNNGNIKSSGISKILESDIVHTRFSEAELDTYSNYLVRDSKEYTDIKGQVYIFDYNAKPFSGNPLWWAKIKVAVDNAILIEKLKEFLS